MMKMRLTALLSAALLAALSLAASADQVYKWVDKDGHTHYSQTPPANSKVNAQSVDISAPAPDPTTLRNEQSLAKDMQDKNQQAADAAKKADEDAQKKAQQQKQCDALRAQVQVVQQAGRVATVDANGNRSYLSDDDRAKRIQQLQDEIGKQCNGG